MNSENSKTSDPHKSLLNLLGKINGKIGDKYVALTNVSIYNAWENMKYSCKKNNFKISDLTWNEELELTDGLYSVSDIQDYFKYISQKNMTELLIILN